MIIDDDDVEQGPSVQREVLRPVLYDAVIDCTEGKTAPDGIDNNAAVLIISEAEEYPKERLSTHKYSSFDDVTRTFYTDPSALPQDRFNGTTARWNWIEDDFPEPGGFDLIVARSMICPCEDHGDVIHLVRKSDGGMDVINTCGGIVPNRRRTVLDRVASLLSRKDGAVAHLTCSPVGIPPTPTGPRPRAGPPRYYRRYVVAYWNEVLREFNNSPEFFATMVYEDDNVDPRYVFSIAIRRR